MKHFLPLTIVLCCLHYNTLAQKSNGNSKKQLPQEVINMPYEFVDRESMDTSPAYEFIAPNFFTKQVNVDDLGNNIVGDAANEPSLAVDPTNPNRMVVGWRQFDDISSDFRQAGYGFSTNGGYDWIFPGVLDPGLFRSDPVLDFDNAGNFYYNSLQGNFECDVFAIRDGGVVWEPPVPANGGDKQWMRIDRTGGPSSGHNYSYWNQSFSTCPGAFTRSTDDAMSFETCENVPGNPFWGTLAVDADANLYLVGTTSAFNGDLFVIKSTDANDAGSPVTFEPPVLIDLDGSLGVQDAINPQGLKGQAWIDVDISAGPGRDNVYVLASVERASSNDPADVMFTKSTDGGATFSPPIRINTDPGDEAYQWFGTMAVAPNGRIDAVWLDTRDADGGFDSVLYYSFSEDQGDTWSENTPISEPFDPKIGYPVQQKMGDYFDMKSDNEYAHIAWCATFTGGEDVYYTRVSPDGTLGLDDEALFKSSFTVSPNPITTNATISFLAAGDTKVGVYDMLGREVAVLRNEVLEGTQQIDWNSVSSQGTKVASGLYFVTVNTNGFQATKKVVVQ
ncbi:T9SS type A sorting domain-containing protein [Rasiella rasia]|uniref:T9SS type A sorting domain-containing protein n=1 Tax=Rasiella rasia TaxID=2744027 RepID=A0A6G6GJ37_9FLAO|nr:T9SS type A sorting domain-containing protein [Rasiella rasia]QIE58433.1 T9SS type A sorting domain-containing protein [Rasiella rasia]